MTILDKMVSYLKGKGWVEKKVLAHAIGQKDVSNLSRNIRKSPGAFEEKKDGKRNMIKLTKKGKKLRPGEPKPKPIKREPLPEKIRREAEIARVKALEEKAKKVPKKTEKRITELLDYMEKFGVDEKTAKEDLALISLGKGIEPLELEKKKEPSAVTKRLAKVEKPKKPVIEVHPEVEKKVIKEVSIDKLRAVKKGKSQLKDLINELVLNLPVRKVDYQPYGMQTSQQYRTYLIKMIDLLRKSDASWIKSNIRIIKSDRKKGVPTQIQMD